MGYFVSKATSGLCQPLIAMMPPHDTYIETHLGGGAIMKRKPPALCNIGIDRDAQALAEFECDYPVQRIHGCAHRFLAEYDYRGSELVYSDPPYLTHLKTLPCQVMVSGYPSALYDACLEGWRSLELQVMNQGGVRTEKLWFNFVPNRVHWASHAGRNFTDRQRIKRKAASWGERYGAMPPAERLAVLAAMMAAAELE